MANKMLKYVLKITSISQLTSLRNSFSLPQEGKESIQEFNEKITDLQKWLKFMIGNDDKHISRVQKYERGTYWTEHLYQL